MLSLKNDWLTLSIIDIIKNAIFYFCSYIKIVLKDVTRDDLCQSSCHFTIGLFLIIVRKKRPQRIHNIC